MMCLRKLLLAATIAFVQLAYAETTDDECLPYTIVFGNGVGNSKEDAYRSLAPLTKLIGTKYKNNVNYKIAYNPTDGPGVSTILDVVEAAKQKAGENNLGRERAFRVVSSTCKKMDLQKCVNAIK